MRTIRGVPRGEVLIFRKDLTKYNAEREEAGLEPFANPRNAAAGAVRMLDPREVAQRPLRALFYQVVEGPKLHATHSESLKWIAAQGLPSHRLEKIVTSVDELRGAIDASDTSRDSYPYESGARSAMRRTTIVFPKPRSVDQSSRRQPLPRARRGEAATTA